MNPFSWQSDAIPVTNLCRLFFEISGDRSKPVDSRFCVVNSGPGIDNILAMTVHTGGTAVKYYYVKDHLGSVQAIVDSSGDIVESYEYDAFGNVLGVFDASGTPIENQQSQINNRFLWQGREYSWNTRLYYFRARWYDPVTGRWLSKDPIGISGGVNQYVFCNNNPVNSRDPLGLDDSYSLFGLSLVIGRGGTVDLGITRNNMGEWSLDLTYGYIARGGFVSVNTPFKGRTRRVFDQITKYSHNNKKKCPEADDYVGKVGAVIVLDYEASNMDINKDVVFTGIEYGIGWATFKTHTVSLINFNLMFAPDNVTHKAFNRTLMNGGWRGWR